MDTSKLTSTSTPLQSVYPTAKKPLTLVDLGFDGCFTCNDSSCNSNVTSLADGKEFNLHIQQKYNYNASPSFVVTKTCLHGEEDLCEEEVSTFASETELVDYLQRDYKQFRCF